MNNSMSFEHLIEEVKELHSDEVAIIEVVNEMDIEVHERCGLHGVELTEVLSSQDATLTGGKK